MRNRLVILPAAMLLAFAAAFAADNGPRTPEGRPDFSGTYDITTLTPVMRPANLGNRMALTEEEAKAEAKKVADELAKANQRSDPNRAAPPKGGDGSENDFLSKGASGNVGGYNAFFIDPGENSFKIDGKWRTSIIVDPPNGRLPNFTPEGMKRAVSQAGRERPNRGDAWWIKEKTAVGPYDDPEIRPLAERCLLSFGQSPTTPALPNYFYNNLKRIVQAKDAVVLMNEMIHDVRVVRMNAKHDPPEIRRWMGDSIGRWEGDTLVVDTTNFNETPGLFGADRNLHVIEKFSRIDGKTLLYQFTIDDPTVWAKSWSGEMPWPATDNRIYEYACSEGNYSFGNILRGARRLEGEELAKQAAGQK